MGQSKILELNKTSLASQSGHPKDAMFSARLYMKIDNQGLNSISVRVTLVWTSHLHSNVVRLLLAQLCEVSTQSWKVKPCNLLIKFFGQQIDVVLVFARSVGLFPIPQQTQLSQGLVGE